LARFIACFSYNYVCRVSEKCNTYTWKCDCFAVAHLVEMSNVAKNFDILATGLSVLHNYFDSSTKLFF